MTFAWFLHESASKHMGTEDGGAVAGDSEARSPYSCRDSLGEQQLWVATKPIIASIIGRNTTENELSAQLGLVVSGFYDNKLVMCNEK